MTISTPPVPASMALISAAELPLYKRMLISTGVKLLSSCGMRAIPLSTDSAAVVVKPNGDISLVTPDLDPKANAQVAMEAGLMTVMAWGLLKVATDKTGRTTLAQGIHEVTADTPFVQLGTLFQTYFSNTIAAISAEAKGSTVLPSVDNVALLEAAQPQGDAG